MIKMSDNSLLQQWK